ncbi:MAG: enoyl-CoA hydratase/isomerase family protein, partial [Alphaproteobacteria bacterium]
MTDFTMFDFKVTDGVAVATFNRPDKMNTFTP